jgi:hypothetical protein
VSGNATQSATMTVLFNASATPAAAQALLQRLYFDNTSSNPVELPSRVMQVVVLDGDGGTSVVSGKAINVNNVNAAPTIAFPTGPLAYTENDPATLIDPAATLVDGDSTTFATPLAAMQLQFTGGTGTATDVLSIRNIGIGAGQIGYTAGTGVVTYGGATIGTAAGGVWNAGTSTHTPLLIAFTNTATPAAAQALLRAIEYSQVLENNPSTTPRQIEASANDGQDASTPVTMVVNVGAVNDAPTANAFPLGTIDGVPVMVDLQAEGQVSDPDSLAASVSFSIQSQPAIGQGTVTVHPTRTNTFVYTPDGFVGATSFTYDATDGLGTSAPATVNLYVTRRLGENRPLPLTDAPRLVYRLNNFRYNVAGDVSQLAGFPNLVFRLAGDAPAGVTIGPASPASATGAEVQWNSPLGAAPAHQQFGVIFTDTVSGTSGFIPLQYILLPDPATGG